MKYDCPNCGVVTKLRSEYPNIPDLTERMDPGEPVPAGECADCGMLVHECEKLDTETKHTPFRPTPDNIEGFCEHALLKSIPDITRTTAHWLIANAKKVASAPDMAKEIAQLKSEITDLKCTIHAARGLIAPLGNQVTPSVLAIREAVSILSRY